MLVWRDHRGPGAIDLPVEAAMLAVPHAVHQKPVADARRLPHDVVRPPLAHQPRRQPEHARLRDDHLRRLALEMTGRVEVDQVAAVFAIDDARIPEGDDGLLQVALDGRCERPDILGASVPDRGAKSNLQQYDSDQSGFHYSRRHRRTTAAPRYFSTGSHCRRLVTQSAISRR
jgi:hypothetical protein